MDSLTVSEISLIARQQRDVGLQRLSSHFSWTEFCDDDRQSLHQEFVYDVAMFASTCGLSWPNVIRAAVMAKHIFPKLKGLNKPDLIALFLDALSEGFPNITPVQRHQFSSFLINFCITQTRLFNAVVSGVPTPQLLEALEVQLPPTPCPLAQGMDLHEWERQQHQAQLTKQLDQKVEELRDLREGPRVTLGDLDVPEGVELDEKGLLEVVRTTVGAASDQMLASLTQEASLLSDIHGIKLQQAALTTGGHPNPVVSNPGTPVRASANSRKDKRVSRKGLRGQNQG
ncbi:uncharacterized protein C8orf74 homolog [Xyrichtys novacula]|uniref:Uncharacterized protein C8orf74 homolog n=1 Tax=Xyrichtys novacula TaxID=13765 RepID=A0AAV1HN39_XYRNO|nr:uncharacterized protein C8orf74 homolog [Xyrichtys novacula]